MEKDRKNKEEELADFVRTPYDDEIKKPYVKPYGDIYPDGKKYSQNEEEAER